MSFSDYSSLTDISEDEAYEPAPKAKRTREKGQYTIKVILKPPRQTTYSAKALYEMMVEGNIDLNPEYQRDVVWTDVKQSNLIDSLLRNFAIPPVVFALQVDEIGTEKRICIDGKQRLTSMLRFMDGQIPHRDSRTGAKHWYKLNSSNKTGKVLPLPYRQQFANKQIVCIEYLDIDEKAEREIFQRVQLGVALTPAERMQAISSPWADLVREGVKEVADTINNKLRWQSQRGTDFQCVASVIYLVEKKTVTYSAATSLETYLRRTTGPTQAFKEKILNAILVLSTLLEDKKYAKPFQEPTKVSPAEFIMILYLIHQYMGTASLSQLDTGIAKLRVDVRSEHSDIRNNGKCNKTMLSFVKERYPANLKVSPDETALHAAKRLAANAKGPKRKREEPEDVEMGEADSDEDVPLRTKSPIKKASKTASGSKASPRVKAEETRATPKLREKSRSSTPHKPIKMEVDSTSQPQVNGTIGQTSDRLAAVRAARALLRKDSAPSSSATRPSSRPTTDMGPPTRSAGSMSLSFSQPTTPVSAVPPSTAPPSITGFSSASTGMPSPEVFQNILHKVQSPHSAGPGQTSFTGSPQIGATQWPGQVPPNSSQQPRLLPPPPQSAPVQDPRFRSNSINSLPHRPQSGAFSNVNGNTGSVPPGPPTGAYRRMSMDEVPRSGSSAMASSSRYEDDRMDRERRRESRFDDRKPPPRAPRERTVSPVSGRERYANGGGPRGPPPRYPPPPPGRDRDSGWPRR